MSSGLRTKLGFLLPAAAFLLFQSPAALAQCCSTGSPVGASVYVGILGKNFLRTTGYFRHSYSKTYFEEDHKSPVQAPLAYSGYNFAGIGLAYGLTRRLTAEFEAGYYFNKTQEYNTIDYTARGYGMSNGTFTVKYGSIVRPARQVELTTGLGFRFPFTTNPQEIDGVQLNRDIQPSTNAFGLSEIVFFNKGFPQISLRLFTINRYDYNFTDKSDYRYGNLLVNSVFVSKKIARNFFGILQIRSEWKTHDRDYSVPSGELPRNEVVNSGYYLLTLVPSLSYSIAGIWNLTAVYDIPLYKYYNGKQMTPSYSFAISLSRDFDLSRKTVKPTAD